MTSSSGLAPSWLENSLGAPPPPRASRSNPRRDNQNQQGSTGSLGSGSGPGGTYVPPSHRANSLSSGGSSYPPRGGSSQVSPPGYSSGRGSSESSRSQRQSHGARPTFDDQYPSLGGKCLALAGTSCVPRIQIATPARVDSRAHEVPPSSHFSLLLQARHLDEEVA